VIEPTIFPLQVRLSKAMGLPTKELVLSMVLTSSTALFSPTFPFSYVPPALAQTQVRADQSLQQALIAHNKPEAALEVTERGRGRAFVELLASRLSSTELQVAIAPPTIEQIKQIAQKQNATLVQYSIINAADKASELYIWVIQPTGDVGFRSFSLKSLNTSLADLIISSRESLGVRGCGSPEEKSTKEVHPLKAIFDVETVPLSEVNSTEHLQQLHQLLIQPIADLLPTDPESRVIFIPQGELFLVPFAALQDANKKYLIEQHTILTAPSIQVLDLTYQQKQRLAGVAKDVLVVGNPTSPKIPLVPGQPPAQLSPLPGAQQEAIDIAKLLSTQPLIGEAATEAAIAQKLPQARIIHLATHTFLENFTGGGVPGAIVLAPSGNDDGLLTASEILNLRLNAELVVLSGDSTALGKITGDGVIGLSRSFMAAGVPNIIGSLWCVPDKPTAVLMTEFYRQLQLTGNPARSLRSAMLKTLKENPNPKNWAAFTLIGTAQ
jgi:CHAT domain-containing protein